MNKAIYWSFLAAVVTCMLSISTVANAQQKKAKGEVKHRFDFEKGFKAITSLPNAATQVSGQFPEGWGENSTWTGSNVRVHYGKETTNPYAGKASWKIRVNQIISGRAQMSLSPVPMEAKRFIRIRFAARSLTNSSCRVVVNMSSAPWKNYWSEQVTASPEWAIYDYIVPPITDDPKSRFQLVFDRPGEIDIDSFEIAYLSKDQLDLQPLPKGNLLSLSSLPAGIATPWTPEPSTYISRDYVADPKTIGPSGYPALKMTPRGKGRPMAQITAPFVGRPMETHTFSVYLKGSKAGQTVMLRMGPPEKDLWKDPYQSVVSLTTEWKRYSVTVKLPYPSRGHYIARVTSHSQGSFWMDGMQVDLSDQPKPFKRSDQVELSLQNTNNYGLFFEGQALSFKAQLAGKPTRGLYLIVSIEDINDKTVTLKRIPVSVKKPFSTNVIKIPDQGLAQLGCYRVEAQVADRRGQPTSRKMEMMIARVRRPKLHKQFGENSPFGIHIHPSHQQAQLVKDLGYNWVRPLYLMDWKDIEIKPGQWDFSEVDHMVDTYQKHRLKILGVLSGAPKRATDCPPDFNRWNVGNWVVRDLKGWSNYAENMAERYKGKIDYWELWNEPFLASFLIRDYDKEKGRYIHGTPEDYYPMLKTASQAVKRKNPKAKVMWNSGAHYDPVWDKQLVKLGAYQHVDIVSYHHYANTSLGFPGDILSKTIQSVYDGKPGHLPVWNTEGGSAGALQGPFREVGPFNIRQKGHDWSDYVVRYYVSTLSNKVDKFFLYTYWTYGRWNANYDWLNQDNSISFNMAAFSNMAWHLEGKQFKKLATLPSGVFAYIFADSDNVVAVILGNGLKRAKLSGRRGLKVRDMYGNDAKLPCMVGSYAVFVSGETMTVTQMERALKSAVKPAKK